MTAEHRPSPADALAEGELAEVNTPAADLVIWEAAECGAAERPAAIDPAAMRAWVALLHYHASVIGRLSDDLDKNREVPFGTYDVLVQLSEAGGKLRLKDLLTRVVLSQPGLSRKVERLAGQGLVQRLPDPHDGRGVIVALTPAGLEALRSAAVVHMSGIHRDFAGRLTPAEASVLADVFERLRHELESAPR